MGPQFDVFLRNGARLYLDVGSHPEYATAEYDNLTQLVTHDRAGERVLEDLLIDAEQRLPTRVSAATSICSRTTPTRRATGRRHENYLIVRAANSPGSPMCCCRSWSPAS